MSSPLASLLSDGAHGEPRSPDAPLSSARSFVFFSAFSPLQLGGYGFQWRRSHARVPLVPLLRVHSRRLLSLEQRRLDHLYPPLDVFEPLREPRCPPELVGAFPMARGMK